MNTEKANIIQGQNQPSYNYPSQIQSSVTKPQTSANFISHNNNEGQPFSGTLKRSSNKASIGLDHKNSASLNPTSITTSTQQTAIQLLNSTNTNNNHLATTSALGVSNRAVVNDAGDMFQTIARDKESMMDGNKQSEQVYGNFIRNKMGTGSPKNHNGIPRTNQSPMKSEEFKGISKVVTGNINNHHGIMSDLGISQNSTTNGVVSLGNEGNGGTGNQYRTMMIAEMNSQQMQKGQTNTTGQQQAHMLFSDGGPYNGYNQGPLKNASYFSNGVSHQNSGMQVKFPTIKNQKDTSEPSSSSNFRSPQRISQHMDRQMIVSDSEKRIFYDNTQSMNQPKGMESTQTKFNVNQQEAMSIKKAVNLTKKVAGHSHNLSSVQQSHQLTEDMIMRNARFHSSTNHQNNLNTLNHLLFGPNTINGNIQTPQAQNLQVSGHKHDILLQEGRKNSSILKPPTHHGNHQSNVSSMMQQIKLINNNSNNLSNANPSGVGIIVTPQVLVKKQYNHQYSNMKSRGKGLNIAEETPAMVFVNKMNTPTNMHPKLTPANSKVANGKSNERLGGKQASIISQSDYASTIIQQQNHKSSIKGGLNHYDSQKSNFFDQTPQRDQILVQGHHEQQQSRLGQYNYQNSPQPAVALLSERANQQPQQYQQMQQQLQQTSEYLSPKLLYKKKKRDYYHQPLPKHVQAISGQMHLINPHNLGKNHFLAVKEQSPMKPGNINSLNNMINQLMGKPSVAAGQSQQSVMQALKNIAGINGVNKDYPLLTASEAMDVIQRAIQSQGEGGKQFQYYLPSLGQSISQEVLQDSLSNANSKEDFGPNPLEASHKSPLVNVKASMNKNGKLLNANELYELAKQIKYKQYQQQNNTGVLSLGLQEKRKNNLSLITGGNLPHMSTKDETRLLMMEALNVVKLKGSSDSVDRFNQRESQNIDHPAAQQQQQPLQMNKQVITGKEQNLQFVFRYMNNNNEMVVLPDDNHFTQRIEQELHNNRDSSRNSISKKIKQQQNQVAIGIKDEDLQNGMIIQGLNAQGSHYNDSKLKMVMQQSIDSVISSASGSKHSKLRSSGIIPHGILISQVNMMFEESKHLQSSQSPGRDINPTDNYQMNSNNQQPMAFGQPMTLMGGEQHYGQQVVETNPNNFYIKEFMKNRNQRKSVKQAQLAKISRIQDLEKLLMMQPGFEDAPVLNTNPGGGGRVVNRADPKQPGPSQQVLPQKRRIEPQISDNENEAMADHPINKTIKMITILNQLLFKGLKEFNPVQQEILNRCTRYFQFQIPKQFKQELQTLVKQKDFLSTVREKMFTTLYTCINKANGITDQVIQANQALGTYKYYIGGGNNHMLVKQVFKQRTWWLQSEKESFEECNFMWTQWLKERHIKTLPSMYDKKQNEETVDANLQDPVEQESQPPAPAIKIYNKMHDNHCLSDKKHLFFNMRDLYQAEDRDLFSVMPLTYVINDGLNDIEFDKFEAQFKAIQEKITNKPQTQNSQNTLTTIQQENTNAPEVITEQQPLSMPKQLHNIWIIKPGEDTNRGSGIIVSKDFNEIKQLVRDKSSRQNKTAILQKYIENPLLINRRKFDIRCYGLMTSVNGNFLGYFYQDGYLRTSSKEFSVQNLNNKYIHLTNDAIQKNSEDYGKFENANKLSYQDFDRYFAEFPHQDYEFRFQRDFLPQIRALVRDTFRAAEKKIDPQRRMNTFEVFGYDFMIDDDLKLKLIEVNTNPSIEICCPLLARIIPSMLESVFKIAIDPLFQQPPNRRIWSSTEAITDLKMDLIFESQCPPAFEQTQSASIYPLASISNLPETPSNREQQQQLF